MDPYGARPRVLRSLQASQGQVVVPTKQRYREDPTPDKSPQSSPDVVLLDEETPNSVIKIRIFPTKPQKSLLNKMFGTHRAVYNKLVESPLEECYVPRKSELVAKYRPISQKRTLETYLPDHHLEVPKEVMDSTFRDFTKVLESSKALYPALKEKDKKTTFPKLRSKSRKDNSSSIELRARGFKSSEGVVRFKSTFFGFSKAEGFLVKEEAPELQFSVRLQSTCGDRFYLCVPRVKTFAQTCYPSARA